MQLRVQSIFPSELDQIVHHEVGLEIIVGLSFASSKRRPRKSVGVGTVGGDASRNRVAVRTLRLLWFRSHRGCGQNPQL